MASDTKNILTFKKPYETPEQNFLKFKSMVLDNERNLTFNKLIPMPSHIYTGDVGSKTIEWIRENNIVTQFDWKEDNWGAKRDAYCCSLIRDEEGYFAIYYETAWSAAKPVMDKIFELAEKLAIDVRQVSVCEFGYFAFSREYDTETQCEYNEDLKHVWPMMKEMLSIINSSFEILL